MQSPAPASFAQRIEDGTILIHVSAVESGTGSNVAANTVVLRHIVNVRRQIIHHPLVYFLGAVILNKFCVRWDPAEGDFVRDGANRMVECDGREAYSIWCFKIAQTEILNKFWSCKFRLHPFSPP